MYTRILVPLDGSETAEQVLPYATAVAKGCKARVELLGIFAPVAPTLADPRGGLSLDRILANVQRHVRDYLERIAASLRSEGLTVSSTVHEGVAAASIVQAAERDPDTLVVLCTHGWSGTTIRALGSTADGVLLASTRPVFVVPMRHVDVLEPTIRLHGMLVPLDGSRPAEAILPHAVAFAHALRSTVMLLRVTPREEAEAREYLEGIRERLRHQGVSTGEIRVLHGPPSDCIVQTVCATAGCFVALTAPRSAWTAGGATRESIADRLVRRAAVPVLVVRATPRTPLGVPCSLLQGRNHFLGV
jgi:nucleotide-binding universal stress UspA family protein